MTKWLRQGKEGRGFAEIERSFLKMLEDGRHIFDAAANALVGGTDPETIRKDLFDTDRRINETEQHLRRQIVVHGTVHGAQSFPSLLVMMSLAKDAERIGDYAKNIFDLAALGLDFGDGGVVDKLVSMKDRVSLILGRTQDVFAAQDEAGAREVLSDCDDVEDECDAELEAALKSAGANAAPRALAYRYMKRVASHAANVATSLVMPLDKLDFFDED